MKELTTLLPYQLREKLDAGSCLLVDVRQPEELAAAQIDGSLNIPLGELPSRLDEIPRDQDLVLMCHHGVRSEQAARILAQAGYEQLSHLGGGIDAWSVEVDDSVPRY